MTPPVHPHDVGLPGPVIKKRRRARYVAHWMLTVAVLTAIAGWLLYGTSFFFALRRPDNEPTYRVILAYGLLMVSSVTLILGLWYLLLAQVNRVARMIEEPDPNEAAALRCGNCGWPHDPADRFCRHCGKPLGASIVAPPPPGLRPGPRPNQPS